MTDVKKLLNVVSACEIRGRLRCSAASIGYRARIRKAFVHSPVTRLSRNLCQAGNYHRAAFLPTKGGGETLVSARRFLGPRIHYICAPNARFSHLCGILRCLPHPPGNRDRRRRESRLIRPPGAISRTRRRGPHFTRPVRPARVRRREPPTRKPAPLA